MWCRMLFLRLLTASIVAVAFTEAPGFAQTAPVRNPQAVLLLGQAISRLSSPSPPVSDLSLTANAAYTAGSETRKPAQPHLKRPGSAIARCPQPQ